MSYPYYYGGYGYPYYGYSGMADYGGSTRRPYPTWSLEEDQSGPALTPSSFHNTSQQAMAQRAHGLYPQAAEGGGPWCQGYGPSGGAERRAPFDDGPLGPATPPQRQAVPAPPRQVAPASTQRQSAPAPTQRQAAPAPDPRYSRPATMQRTGHGDVVAESSRPTGGQQPQQQGYSATRFAEPEEPLDIWLYRMHRQGLCSWDCDFCGF